MNNERRKILNDCKSKVEALIVQFQSIKDEVEGVKNEEEEAYENMPDGLKNGERGETAQAAISAMDDFISAIESLDDIPGHLETASE